jgi:hypothetical protein
MLWALLAGRDDEPNGHGQRTGKSAVCTRWYRPRNWTSRCDTSPGRA